MRRGFVLAAALLVGMLFTASARGARDVCEESIFEIARYGTSRDVLAAAAQGMDFNERDHVGWPPLVWALDNPDLDAIRFLLVGGAQVNATDLDGDPMWVYAFRSERHTEIFRILLDAGLSLDSVERNGIPMFYIFTMSRSDVTPQLRMLLERGVDVNQRSPSFSDIHITPLMAAAEFGNNPQVIRLLLDAGADVNASDDEGGTPLHYAAGVDNHNPQVVRVLLDAGADFRAMDLNGQTVLCKAAAESGERAVVEMLLDAGVPLSPDLEGLTPCDWLSVNGWLKSDDLLRRRLCGGTGEQRNSFP